MFALPVESKVLKENFNHAIDSKDLEKIEGQLNLYFGPKKSRDDQTQIFEYMKRLITPKGEKYQISKELEGLIENLDKPKGKLATNTILFDPNIPKVTLKKNVKFKGTNNVREFYKNIQPILMPKLNTQKPTKAPAPPAPLPKKRIDPKTDIFPKAETVAETGLEPVVAETRIDPKAKQDLDPVVAKPEAEPVEETDLDPAAETEPAPVETEPAVITNPAVTKPAVTKKTESATEKPAPELPDPVEPKPVFCYN